MKTIKMPLEARINALAVLDAQRGNVGQIRLCARIAEKIELSNGERAAIGYTTVPHPSGADIPAWNRNASLADKEIGLNPEEARRLKQALEECEMLRPRDLAWLEPLLAQLKED
jgi:hypothetical protein